MSPMIRKTMIMFTTAALAFSGTALSGDIYKWTDEDGNVIDTTTTDRVVDRPTPSVPPRVCNPK